MGKKKKQGGKRGGSRFFRWIRSDLPDEEDTKSPVLLLGVTKISDSPSLSRRRQPDSPHRSTSGSGRFSRPPKSKYHRGSHGDERLEKIRQDLLTHKNQRESYIPEVHSNLPKEQCEKHKIRQVKCLTLNCVGTCKDCERDRSLRSSSRGSFLFHRTEGRQSSLCPSEPYEPSTTKSSKDLDHDIEHRYSEHIPNNDSEQGPSDTARSNHYSVTPKSTERRSLLLSNLNERFRKTLSLDSKQTNRVPLSLPQNRPQSMVHSSQLSPKSYRSDDTFLEPQEIQPKKKRFRPKSFFSLETFFDSKRSDSSSGDYSSSKYKKFELESDDSPIFRDRLDLRNRREKEKTPDLLNLPFIIDSLRKKEYSDPKGRLEKLESHYYRNLGKTVVDAIPKDATDICQGTSNTQNFDEDEVEYIEPIRSNFTSQSTLIIDSKNPYDRPYTPLNINIDPQNRLNTESALSNNTDETDIRIPSSNLTVSPKSNAEVIFENDIDSIGPYEIEVKEADLIINRTKDLIVKIMDKSVDSIGSCSLDVDASTDFSDTTSGSLNLLTPSSTTSRIRDFTSRIQERAASANLHANNRHLLAHASLNPSPACIGDKTDKHSRTSDCTSERHRYDHSAERNKSDYSAEKRRAKTTDSATEKRSLHAKTRNDNSLKPPQLIVQDTSSHRSRSHKKEQKKPSYLNLACSVNGYSNLTTYDSKLRQHINNSREASPIRPITQTCREYNKLVVPVPVSVDKLIVPTFQPHDSGKNLTAVAPSKAHPDPYLTTSPILVYMAAENRQLKSNFLGKNMAAATSSNHSFNESSKLRQSKTNDEVDNINVSKELTFKSSYSETNVTSKRSSCSSVSNGKTESRFISSESYTIHSTNGISKHVEITKENGEKLTSPMKSFIQQRVERLYGPGALAQGFFNQKRHKNKNQSEAEETISEANKILTEKSLNCHTERQFSNLWSSKSSKDHQNIENIECTTNGDPKSSALPVLRHLRPEFRAQLPVLSPKKSPGRTDITPVLNGSSPTLLNLDTPKKSKTETSFDCLKNTELAIDISTPVAIKDSEIVNGSVNVSELTNNVNGIDLSAVTNGDVKMNGVASEVRDAYYFLDLEKQETERLMQLSARAEGYLESLQKEPVSEEILGLLRSAAGKARLLATQKMQQFEGLCYNHINERAGEQFPTTLQDLQGFWDMVCLQVRNVDQLFQDIEALRSNQWVELEPEPSAVTPVSSPSSTVSPRSGSRLPRGCAAATPHHKNEKARLAAEKREADRKNMLEHRRRMVREKQLAAKSCAPGTSREDDRVMAIEGAQEVEIFIGKAAKASKVAPQGDQKSHNDSDYSINDRS